MHKSKSVRENEMRKILWNFGIEADHQTPARKPVPADYREKRKENEKIYKYHDLAREQKSAVKHEGDGDINCCWYPWNRRRKEWLGN